MWPHKPDVSCVDGLLKKQLREMNSNSTVSLSLPPPNNLNSVIIRSSTVRDVLKCSASLQREKVYQTNEPVCWIARRSCAERRLPEFVRQPVRSCPQWPSWSQLSAPWRRSCPWTWARGSSRSPTATVPTGWSAPTSQQQHSSVTFTCILPALPVLR